MKPMLACDWDEDKIKFPCGVLPKIDGVRGVHLTGKLTGRSLKEHGNRFTNKRFSSSTLAGFDGELTLGVIPHADDLCRMTTSAVASHSGEPDVYWWVFDYITPETANLLYHKRYEAMLEKVKELQHPKIAVVPMLVCHNMQQLLDVEEMTLSMGYEGIILRDLNGKYKQGRSTVREGGYLRIKRFVEEDAKVIGFEEGSYNGNEAQINELGQTERSTHKENMVPNGLIGNLLCEALKDVVVDGKVIIACGQHITVAPGKMLHEDRKRYFDHPDVLIGQVIKFKFFPKGIKDKLRFPTFQSFRATSDTV